METKVSHNIHTYTDNDLISEEHQSEMTGLANADRVITFRVGDIAIEEIEDKARRGIAVSHDRIDEAVGRFFGKTARTIRYYRETAVFFSEDVRAEYDMLPFSFFVFARSMAWQWHDVLEYAAINPHIRLEGLKIQFLGLRVASTNGQVASSFRDSSGSSEMQESDCEMQEYGVLPDKIWKTSSSSVGAAISTGVAHDNLTVVNRFASALPEVIAIVSDSSLPVPIKAGILSALRTVEKLMPEVIKNMI